MLFGALCCPRAAELVVTLAPVTSPGVPSRRPTPENKDRWLLNLPWPSLGLSGYARLLPCALPPFSPPQPYIHRHSRTRSLALSHATPRHAAPPHPIRPDWWWTGTKPTMTPGVQQNGEVSSLPQLCLATCTREEFQAYFDNTWALTEVMFGGLQGEAPFYAPPKHFLRHP